MTLSILVPQELAPAVAKRLKKLAKSCGVEVTEVAGTTTLVRDKNVLVCRRITVGDMPRESGYAFVARLEHMKDGNVVTRAPGEFTADLDEAWRTQKADCQHCKTQRFRKETFILRTPEGELRQIARNCLADFMASTAASLVRLADLSREIGGCMDEARWGSYHWDVSPVGFMACAASAIEAEGFSKSDEECPTKNTATFLAGPRPKDQYPSEQKYWDDLQPKDHHVALAKATVDWLADHAASGSSEYIWNLRLCIAEPDVGKHAGLLASATVSYQRYLGKQIKAKVESKQGAPVAGYAAPVKEVFQGEVTLLRAVHVPPSDNAKFPTSKTICTFRAASGHEIVWFATGNAPSLDQSTRYTIKGRVKKHESYRGVDQTVLQRVSFKAIEQEKSA